MNTIPRERNLILMANFEEWLDYATTKLECEYCNSTDDLFDDGGNLTINCRSCWESFYDLNKEELDKEVD